MICFNIFEAIKYPSDLHFISTIDDTKTLVQKFYELSSNDNFEVRCKNLRKEDFKEQTSLIELDDKVEEVVTILDVAARLHTNRYDVFTLNYFYQTRNFYLRLCMHLP